MLRVNVGETSAAAETSNAIVTEGDKEDTDKGSHGHTADDGDTDRAAGFRPGTGGKGERQTAEDEGERGHEDGAQARRCAREGGLQQRHALREAILRELHPCLTSVAPLHGALIFRSLALAIASLNSNLSCRANGCINRKL